MGTQTTAKEAPVCLFRCTLPEFGAPDMLGGGEKQATVMDTPSPGLWKLVNQGPAEETSVWGWGGKGGGYLVRSQVEGPWDGLSVCVEL